MQLFAEKGFHETSIDEIAEAAEVSRATVFNYFGSKDGLLAHYSSMLADHLQRLAETHGNEPSALTSMRRFLEGWLDHIHAHRDEARQVYLHAFANPGALLTPARRTLLERFSDMVAEGQAAGELRSDLSAERLGGLILSVYQTVVISYLLAGEPLDELKDAAWRFVMEGVRPLLPPRQPERRNPSVHFCRPER